MYVDEMIYMSTNVGRKGSWTELNLVRTLNW